MTSFRRRESAKQTKRKTGKRNSEFDNSRHYEHKTRKLMTKDKSDKYRRYDSEDI